MMQLSTNWCVLQVSSKAKEKRTKTQEHFFQSSSTDDELKANTANTVMVHSGFCHAYVAVFSLINFVTTKKWTAFVCNGSKKHYMCAQNFSSRSLSVHCQNLFITSQTESLGPLQPLKDSHSYSQIYWHILTIVGLQKIGNCINWGASDIDNELIE